MNRLQTVFTSARNRPESDVLDTIFAALTQASSFVPLGSTHPSAPLDLASDAVPRFRGWVAR